MNYKRTNLQSLYKDFKEADVACVYQDRYAPFLRDCEDFRKGAIRHMMVFGAPGIGKSENLKSDSGYSSRSHSAQNLYRFSYEHRNEPLIFDDLENALRTPDVVSVLKMLMDSRDVAQMSWGRANYEFEKLGIPRNFETTSNSCIMLNNASRLQNGDVGALLSRARVIVFNPSPAEILHYARGWWVQKNGDGSAAVLDFCEQHADRIRTLHCRTMEQALQDLRRGVDWKQYLLQQWDTPTEDPETRQSELIKEILKTYPTTQQQLAAWTRLTKGQRRNAFYKAKRKFGAIEKSVTAARSA